jgi:CPA2 family monovalent cation:H+ antiporter-2
MTDFLLVAWVAIILLAAFLGGFLAKKAKQPAVLGYLLAGIVIGGIAGKFLPDKGSISFLAEIGVALLMFTLGLELSFSKLRKVGEVAFWGGMVQILLVIIASILIFPYFGFDFYSSLFLGCAFSLSSTAIVVKLLSERGEIDTLPGEIMLGWLLVQDLAVLPMVVILPTIAISGASFWLLALSILKAVGFLAVVIFVGKQLVSVFISKIADLGSRELLLLSVVAFCLLTAIVTSAFGLSIALGAFLAGLLIAETAESHAIFSEIRPLRDLFSIIFFVSLGMFLRPEYLWGNILPILATSFLIIVLKLLIVTILVFYLGYHTKTAIIVGLGLVQVGEFAFVLSRIGSNLGLIDNNVYSLILSVAIVTILLTPWLVGGAPKFYFWARRVSQKRLPRLYYLLFTRYDHRLTIPELPLENHVVICGHGRVGSWLGRALELLEIPYIVIDYNHKIIKNLKEKRIKAVYGDPADIDVLDYAQVDKAKIVVVAIPDQATQEVVVTNCQTLNPKVKIICRAHQKEAQSRLSALGVSWIIQPEFEASLSIIHRVLQFFGVTREEVAGKIKRIKIEHGME